MSHGGNKQWMSQGEPPAKPDAAENVALTAAEILRDHQRQLDADGCMVGVSRQAIDEVLAERFELRTLLSAAYRTPGNNFPDSYAQRIRDVLGLSI